jgi:hypothetical protein
VPRRYRTVGTSLIGLAVRGNLLSATSAHGCPLSRWMGG